MLLTEYSCKFTEFESIRKTSIQFPVKLGYLCSIISPVGRICSYQCIKSINLLHIPVVVEKDLRNIEILLSDVILILFESR